MSIPSLADLVRDGERREPPLEPITPLPANYNGELVTVTAILERTAVFFYGTDDRDKALARLDRLDVNAGLFEARDRWKLADGGRRSEHGAPNNQEASRNRGRAHSHKHKQSKKSIAWHEEKARLRALGLAFCTRGKHEVPLLEISGRSNWCRACFRDYYHRNKSQRVGSSANVAA